MIPLSGLTVSLKNLDQHWTIKGRESKVPTFCYRVLFGVIQFQTIYIVKTVGVVVFDSAETGFGPWNHEFDKGHTRDWWHR